MLAKRYYLFLKNLLFDFFFPRICIGCGSEGEWICSGCIRKTKVVKQPFCPECRTPTFLGEFCHLAPDQAKPDERFCKDKFTLEGIMICAHYEDGVLKKAIHEFKYNFVFDIGHFLGALMAQKLRTMEKWTSFDLVIPIPLHPKRLKFRGFNQAEILARSISEKTDLKLDTKGLKRARYSTPQAELNRAERLENLKYSFVWDGGDLKDKSILLVDDITTTGTTLEECAGVLKSAGADQVWGIVLGKGK